MILVTGANGTTGGEVVRQLAKAKKKVRALVRDRAKAAARFDDAVEIVVGDLERPDTLGAAFSGVEASYVVAPNDGSDMAALEANAFEAAKRAGVKKIVKLSASRVDTLMAGSPAGEMHVASERRLRELGIPWTILRPGPFMSSLIVQWRLLESGALALPSGEGKEPLIDPRDIAAVAIEALKPGRYDGMLLELTGPEVLSYAEAVQKIGRAVGRRLRFVDMPEDTWRQTMISAGVPELLVDVAARWFAAVRAGEMKVTSCVADVLGHPGHTLDQWLADGGATR